MKFSVLLILLGAVLLSTATTVHGRSAGIERERWNLTLPAHDVDYLYSEARAWDTGLLTETLAWAGPFEWCRPTVPPAVPGQREPRLLARPCEPAADPASPRDPPAA